ncbi:MAG TPA: hypothetical protein VF116_18445 [Ktedonobacterales bacterium]
MSTVRTAHDVPASVPAGSLALGVYLMLLAVVFYVPFALSPLAQQNDVFMTNLYLGLGAFTAGSVLVAVDAAREAAHKPWLTAMLGTLAGVVAFAGVTAFFYGTQTFAGGAPVMAGYTALLLALGVFAGARGSHLIGRSRALLVGLSGGGLITLYYALLGGQYYDAYGLATYLPRFVDGQTSGLALLLGVGVFFLARFWVRRP